MAQMNNKSLRLHLSNYSRNQARGLERGLAMTGVSRDDDDGEALLLGQRMTDRGVNWFK